MSLAREISEKLDNRKQAKGEPGPLPSEKSVQPSPEANEDPGKVDQSEKEGSGPLLSKPIAIESRYLDGAVVYLVQDEIMASEAEKKGFVVFTEAEIRAMASTERSMNREEWISCLKAVCQTKKVFEGSRVMK